MRIALVSDWCLPRLGGIELQLRDLAVHLKARGHEVEIITPVEGPPALDGIPVHRLGAPRMPGAGIVFTAGAFARIRELYLAGRYDVVHVHFGIIAPAAYGATFIAQQLGIPTVATFHSVLTHFDLPLAAIRALMGVDDWQVQWSAVSSVVADSMRPLVGAAPVTVVPNGIDLSFWSHRRNARRPAVDGLRAVAVMRLHRRKRPRLLLDAVERCGGAVRLAIIGDGVERAPTERSIRRRGMEELVTMPGWLPQDEVRDAMRDADFFLLPSRLEAFGIAALEARASGVPVVAMRSGGARDFLRHGHDSLLAGDDAEFASHVQSLAHDPALLARLTAGAMEPTVGAGWDDVLSRVEQVYRAAV